MAESFEKKILDEAQDVLDSEGFDLSDDTLDAIAGGQQFSADSDSSSVGGCVKTDEEVFNPLVGRKVN